MASILILIGAHLCTAPRPQKEADSLTRAGHDVTVRGVWFDPELVSRDLAIAADKPWRFEPVLDFRPQYRFINWRVRLIACIAKEVYQKTKLVSPYLLGYGPFAMLESAQKTRADLTIVHSEAGLWVGNRLSDEGFRVGVDFEDWFSEDLPSTGRIARPAAYLKVLEDKLLRRCEYCLTTSHAMAMAMSSAYLSPEPKVVYNVFPAIDYKQIDGRIKDRRNLNIPSIHWFSQTIGPGRGIEMLMKALPQLTRPVEIHLRGSCAGNVREWLALKVPKDWQQYVFIHPTVPNAELLSRIAEHDIGLALESTDITSRNLTITNKLFQYLQAGIAVVATDTEGQREIFSRFPDCGRLIANGSSRCLADAITYLLGNSNRLSTAKFAALHAAHKLDWEQQSKKIMMTAKAALLEETGFR